MHKMTIYFLKLFITQFLMSVFINAFIHNYLELSSTTAFVIAILVNLFIVPSFIALPEKSNEQE